MGWRKSLLRATLILSSLFVVSPLFEISAQDIYSTPDVDVFIDGFIMLNVNATTSTTMQSYAVVAKMGPDVLYH